MAIRTKIEAHVQRIQDAISMAVEDGYKLDFWFHLDHDGDVEEIVANVIRLERKDGWMQPVERAPLAKWPV